MSLLTDGRCVLAEVSHVLGDRWPMCIGPFRKFPVCLVTDGRCAPPLECPSPPLHTLGGEATRTPPEGATPRSRHTSVLTGVSANSPMRTPVCAELAALDAGRVYGVALHELARVHHVTPQPRKSALDGSLRWLSLDSLRSRSLSTRCARSHSARCAPARSRLAALTLTRLAALPLALGSLRSLSLGSLRSRSLSARCARSHSARCAPTRSRLAALALTWLAALPLSLGLLRSLSLGSLRSRSPALAPLNSPRSRSLGTLHSHSLALTRLAALPLALGLLRSLSLGSLRSHSLSARCARSHSARCAPALTRLAALALTRLAALALARSRPARLAALALARHAALALTRSRSTRTRSLSLGSHSLAARRPALPPTAYRYFQSGSHATPHPPMSRYRPCSTPPSSRTDDEMLDCASSTTTMVTWVVGLLVLGLVVAGVVALTVATLPPIILLFTIPATVALCILASVVLGLRSRLGENIDWIMYAKNPKIAAARKTRRVAWDAEHMGRSVRPPRASEG